MVVCKDVLRKCQKILRCVIVVDSEGGGVVLEKVVIRYFVSIETDK